ncbi:ABC transporter B family member 15, partial [Tolypocladium ophioglossoides CBS 100239]
MFGDAELENVTLRIPSTQGSQSSTASRLKYQPVESLRWLAPLASPSDGIIRLLGHSSWRPADRLTESQLAAEERPRATGTHHLTGSVLDKIAHGLVGSYWETATREEQMTQVVEAAKMAFAHGFIATLPNGYETEIGQGGGLLSGGQNRRVAVARSVSQPKALLDEALDKASEGRTTIATAHNGQHRRDEEGQQRLVGDSGKPHRRGRCLPNARLLKVQNLTASAGAAEDAIGGSADVAKTLSRYVAAEQVRTEAQKERDKYDSHGCPHESPHQGGPVDILAEAAAKYPPPAVWVNHDPEMETCVAQPLIRTFEVLKAGLPLYLRTRIWQEFFNRPRVLEFICSSCEQQPSGCTSWRPTDQKPPVAPDDADRLHAFATLTRSRQENFLLDHCLDAEARLVAHQIGRDTVYMPTTYAQPDESDSDESGPDESDAYESNSDDGDSQESEFDIGIPHVQRTATLDEYTKMTRPRRVCRVDYLRVNFEIDAFKCTHFPLCRTATAILWSGWSGKIRELVLPASCLAAGNDVFPHIVRRLSGLKVLSFDGDWSSPTNLYSRPLPADIFHQLHELDRYIRANDLQTDHQEEYRKWRKSQFETDLYDRVPPDMRKWLPGYDRKAKMAPTKKESWIEFSPGRDVALRAIDYVNGRVFSIQPPL